MEKKDHKTIILFDGICNLCNGAVQFLLKRDKKKQFMFASLQSDASKNLLLHYNYKNNDLNFKADCIYSKMNSFADPENIIEILEVVKKAKKIKDLFCVFDKYLQGWVICKSHQLTSSASSPARNGS